MYNYNKALLLSLISIMGLPFVTHAQDSTAQDTAVQISSNKPNFYFNCFRCPEQYIKENINIVNFVRDAAVAQIQMLRTQAQTGGGNEFTLRFIGSGIFEGLTNTVTYFTPSTAIEEEEREEFVRNIRIGLLPFIYATPYKKFIDVAYQSVGDNEFKSQVKDPWNHWVFEINSNVSLQGEESRRSHEIEGRFSADRVTEEWKIDTDLSGNYERNFVDLEVDDGDTTKTTMKTFSFLQTSKRVNALFVNSLNRHWSIGGNIFASTSTFNNNKLKIGIGPAVEFNIFPYSEYNRHELSFVYKISPVYIKYNDLTIFNKLDELLVQQVLSANFEVTETWGEINMGLEASTYLHDFSKNRLDLNGRLNFRIVRGLSVFIRGEYSLINDQLSLPQGDISNKEALLRLRDRATGYSYELSFGVSFTFGSIYNNIVNPRFPRFFGSDSDD